MPIVEAIIKTPRPERYLRQLCDHLANMAAPAATHGHARVGEHHARPPVRNVEHSDTTGVIVFDWGQCTLAANEAALEVRAQSDDPAALARAQQMIGGRIETIGRREHLAVRWRPVLDTAGAQTDSPEELPRRT